MLTGEQKRLRLGKLTASRVAVLMTGDAAGILRLWQELRGEAEPEDLSHLWPVRLGEATEQLNLDWFEEKNQLPVTRRGEVVVSQEIDWAAATLDGWVEAVEPYAIECKHSGGREPIDPVLQDRYAPQCHWIMFVTNTKQLALSIILGASEPVIKYIERNDAYIAELLERAKQFMYWVERGEPPVALPAVPPPIEANRLYDMTGSESWQRHAQQWLQVKGAAETAKEAEKILKALVPEDAKKCWGHGIYISRDSARRLSLREGTLP